MLGQSAQGGMAMIAPAHSGLIGMAIVPGWTVLKSLIARRFSALGKRGNAQINRRGFAVPPEPGSYRLSLISVTHKRTRHGSQCSLQRADKYCKTGVRRGIEGLFGKSLFEVARNDSADSGRRA